MSERNDTATAKQHIPALLTSIDCPGAETNHDALARLIKALGLVAGAGQCALRAEA